VVSDITTDDSVGFVFTSDLKTVDDWSYLEVETEIPAEIAQAEVGDEKREIAPGQVVELGSVEEGDRTDLTDLTDSTDDPTDPSYPSDPSESAITLEEPEATPAAEEIAPLEELPAEPLPGDEAIEEEDLEPCPAGSPECVESVVPPVESPTPPPAAPQNLPIG